MVAILENRCPIVLRRLVDVFPSASGNMQSKNAVVVLYSGYALQADNFNKDSTAIALVTKLHVY
jgi:hypothetical protein